MGTSGIEENSVATQLSWLRTIRRFIYSPSLGQDPSNQRGSPERTRPASPAKTSTAESWLPGHLSNRTLPSSKTLMRMPTLPYQRLAPLPTLLPKDQRLIFNSQAQVLTVRATRDILVEQQPLLAVLIHYPLAREVLLSSRWTLSLRIGISNA